MIQWLCQVRGNLARLAANGYDLFLPPACAFCHVDLDQGDWQAPLCSECLERLAPVVWPSCRRCGSQVVDREVLPERCPRCRKAPLRFDTVVALGGYHAGLQNVILRMKRPLHIALSVAMGRLLAQRRSDRLAELQADMVIPIPMFWARRLWRGTNNPEIVADCVAKSLEIPVQRHILARHRHTQPQAELPPSRRFENVRGAFRVRHPNVVKNARVLLVDDVLTTGATCSEAAKVMKQAGAAWVGVAVVARAEGK